MNRRAAASQSMHIFTRRGIEDHLLPPAAVRGKYTGVEDLMGTRRWHHR